MLIVKIISVQSSASRPQESAGAWGEGIEHEKYIKRRLQGVMKACVGAFETVWLDATSGLGEPGHLTGALPGSRGEQFVDVLELVTGHLGQDADHGSDSMLSVVVLENMDDLPVFLGQFLDAFGAFNIINPLGAPGVKAADETVLIDVESLALKFDACHLPFSF
jgi:hypothetical protein